MLKSTTMLIRLTMVTVEERDCYVAKAITVIAAIVATIIATIIATAIAIDLIILTTKFT